MEKQNQLWQAIKEVPAGDDTPWVVGYLDFIPIVGLPLIMSLTTRASENNPWTCPANRPGWFHTSTIDSITKKQDIFIIKTRNSTYRLIKAL